MIDLTEFVLNPDAAREAEYRLVSDFATHPKAVLRHFNHDPVRLSQFFAFIHSMRRVPPTSMSGRDMYRIGNHEGPGVFRDMVTHALLYRLNQLPQPPKKNRGDMKKVLKQHRIKLRPEVRAQVDEMRLPDEYPRHLGLLVPSVVERAEPDTVDKAISLALLEAATARAKMDKHRLAGQIEVPKLLEEG